MNKAIFLDRDGTLNPDPGYIDHPDKFELFPDTVEALKKMVDAGFILVLVTNQSGIARGLITPEMLSAIHDKLEKLLAEGNVKLSGIYFCPHHPDFTYKGVSVCKCRKPATGMIEMAKSDLDIDLEHSFLIGDRESDLRMALNAGVTPVFIGKELPQGFDKVISFISLNDAADWLTAAKKFAMFD
jgi:D,D-heptose 1,7-bisphosphate phosphatase